MGKSATSSVALFKLRARKGRSYEIRGTYKGFRLDASTGERDEVIATQKASKMWTQHIADVESGATAARAKARGSSEVGFPVVGTRWLLTKPGLAECTKRAHVFRIALLSETFPTVHDCTTKNIEAFITMRLCKVQRQTLIKDLRVLKPILKMCAKDGTIARIPTWEVPAQNERGVKSKNARGKSVKASPAQIERILALLPERTRDQHFPMRAVCTFLWETALRPWLIWRMTTPLNWKPGMKVLFVNEEISKIGLERDLELSPRALEQLEYLHKLYGDNEAACGLLAPAWNNEGTLITPNLRATLQRATTKVLGEDKGSRFHMSCFRPNRITQLIHMGVVPAKVGWLVGQTSSSIQDRYLKTNEDDVAGIYETLDLSTGAQALGPKAI